MPVSFLLLSTFHSQVCDHLGWMAVVVLVATPQGLTIRERQGFSGPAAPTNRALNLVCTFSRACLFCFHENRPVFPRGGTGGLLPPRTHPN